MWLKILQTTKQFTKLGEILEVADDAKAEMYVEAGIAEKSEAPAAATTVESEIKSLVSAAAKAAAAEAVAEITKGLATKLPKKLDHTFDDAAQIDVVGSLPRYGSMRNFPNTNDGRKRAYRFGTWLMGNYAQNLILDPERKAHVQRYVKKCRDMGISLKRVAMIDDGEQVITATKLVGGEMVETKASSENVNASSGFLVPDEFQNDLIDLREKYGVFRQNAKIVPMASDTRSDPRRKGGTQAYFVSEDGAGTQATKSWDRVRLTAKKLMVLSKYSNELNEDALISMADDLAGEAAYAFANKEDDCGFNGTATAAYGGITGVGTKLFGVSGTVANILGITVQTGTGNWNSIVLSDFNKVVGTLPEFADANAKWYMSRTFWGQVAQKLATAGGGNTAATIRDGSREKMFLGYPVVISQVMMKTYATNKADCYFGDLAMAASLGDRRSFTLSLSDAALNSFEQDEMALRATERFDIVVHDVGEDSTATARDPVMGLTAGPIVALFSANT
jgi:HK97 family phage major capsid protein